MELRSSNAFCHIRVISSEHALSNGLGVHWIVSHQTCPPLKKVTTGRPTTREFCSVLEWAKSVTNRLGRILEDAISVSIQRLLFSRDLAHSLQCLTDELNMWQIGLETENAKSRRSQFRMPSGPGDSRTLTRDSLLNTSNGWITYSHGTSLASTEYTAGNGVMSFETCCNELFIRSASSWASLLATLFNKGSSLGFDDWHVCFFVSRHHSWGLELRRPWIRLL